VEVERVPPAARGELLQRTVAALGRRHAGAVAGILDLADGQLLISGTGSLRATNGSAPDADTTLEIGSITKTFTALALAHAVVTGRLSLDTPVRDILPAGTSVPVRDAVEMTVEHLARHTSACRARHNASVCGPSGPPAREVRIRTRRSIRPSC
jgi:serine-type D-Ala-D-Ala carboxypeptidase/endopeptidase